LKQRTLTIFLSVQVVDASITRLAVAVNGGPDPEYSAE